MNALFAQDVADDRMVVLVKMKRRPTGSQIESVQTKLKTDGERVGWCW